MQITDIRVRTVDSEGKMRAVVSITIDSVFVIHDIKSLKAKRECLLPCQAARLQMVSIVI